MREKLSGDALVSHRPPKIKASQDFNLLVECACLNTQTKKRVLRESI